MHFSQSRDPKASHTNISAQQTQIYRWKWKCSFLFM